MSNVNVSPNHGMVAEDDMVLVRWSFSGTQKALGKSVKLIGMSLYRLEDGKIAEAWNAFDELAAVIQLGGSVTMPGMPGGDGGQ